MTSFDRYKYAKYTKAHNWNAICNLNNIKFDSFGIGKELKILGDFLEPDEIVFALSSGMIPQNEKRKLFNLKTHTWLIVVTNDRFIFLNSSFFTKSVDFENIYYHKIKRVSFSKGLILGEIRIYLDEKNFVIDNCQKETVAVLAHLANMLIQGLRQDSHRYLLPKKIDKTSSFDKLEKLITLHKMEALSDEDFEIAKFKLFSSKDFKTEKEIFLSSL